MAERPGFMIYLDLFPQLEEYSMAEVGELVFAMRDYVEYGAVPQFEDRGLRVIWRGVQDRLNRDNERYAEEVEKRKIDGSYGHYVKLCKARGEKPKEKILWLEEDFFPSVKSPQVSTSTLKDIQADLSIGQGRKPTTNPEANTTPSPFSIPKATAYGTGDGMTAGKGFGGNHLPDPHVADNLVEREKLKQAQIEKLDAFLKV